MRLIHEKFKWFARDRDGQCAFYTERPYYFDETGEWEFDGGATCFIVSKALINTDIIKYPPSRLFKVSSDGQVVPELMINDQIYVLSFGRWFPAHFAGFKEFSENGIKSEAVTIFEGFRSMHSSNGVVHEVSFKSWRV